MLSYSNTKISCEISKIESLNYSDHGEKIFFETAKNYQSFEDSWFALIQGIRHNPRVFSRKIYFSDHPYKDNTIVVFNHLCPDKNEFVKKINNLLVKLNKQTAIWKNADPAEVNELKAYGFRCYADTESWSEESRFDDQTFPQYICSVKKIACLNGPYFSQIRQQTRAVEKKYQTQILSYQKNYKQSCLSLGQKSAMNISEGEEKKFYNVINANLIYLKYTPEHAYVVKVDNKICGFIAFDVRNSVANFNCLFYDRSVKYLATFIMVQAVRKLEEMNVNWLNLSGSETQNLNHWKKKFLPIEEIYRTHMVWQYKNISKEDRF